MSYLNGHTPNYGERLVPNIIDDVAKNEPLKVFASIPVSEDLSDGYIDVTYRVIANAINRASWWLSENLGLANTSEVFSYMGPSDLRYSIFLVAAMKCGYQMMIPSPRNSREFQVKLLQRSNSKTVLCARSHTRHFEELQDEDNLDVFFAVVPELSEILEDAEVVVYPFNKSYSEICMNKFMILHTSGSTGPPKPISFSIEATTTEDAHQLLDDPSHKLWWRLFANRRYFVGMPCFHSAGIWFSLFMPVYFGSTVVYGPAKRPLTSDIATKAIVSGRIEGGIYPPSILEDLSKSPSKLEEIRKLKFVAYGGGALSKPAGDKLSRITTLHNFIGFTEASAPPRYLMEPDVWDYFEFHPASGFVAKHYHGDLYTMTFERNPKYESVQACFRILPNLAEYSPGDLISKHPERENLWTHSGRTDDLVVLSNGEKFNPIPMEEALRSCPFVKDVIVSGEGRFQASVIVERDPETALSASSIDIAEALWPFVETANKKSSAHSRIIKYFILVAPSQKPFHRSPKGTLQRKATIKSFEVELNELYGSSKANSLQLETVKPYLAIRVEEKITPASTRREPPLGNSKLTTRIIHQGIVSKSGNTTSADTIRELVATVCNTYPTSDKDDLFELGIDSLQVTELVDQLKEISSSWPQDREAAIQLLYANPSIQGITNVIHLRSEMEESPDMNASAQPSILDETHVPVLGSASIEELVEKYTADLYQLLPNRAKTVVLTGATGSLGCFLLESLMREPSVARIICLHRGENGKENQAIASQKRGFQFNSGKTSVDFFQIDLSRNDLGLQPSHLSDIHTSADAIIHNAWNVDFNQHLTSFETHIAGVRYLAELAARSQRRARLIFVSSIASVINWDTNLGEVPEKVQTNCSVAGDGGYSKSKHTAEQILQRFAASADLNVSIVRVGQIAGPIGGSTGTWSASDWLPMLVKTSKTLGILPKSLGTGDDIDWVPIDVVAKAFMDVLRHELHDSHEGHCQVYHIASPRKTSWGALLPATCHVLGKDIGLVPFHEWVHKLQEQSRMNCDAQKLPALKILPFYKAMIAPPEARMPVLDTTHTVIVSKALANLDAVQGVWMERWIPAWTS
ncbi:male sterility protein-domain-containing protein [Xylaria castorea]|nr:male sterility protein-domain-containing protein [Xylaria castorea]